VRRTPPPVDVMWAIYGINLPTETMYFYKPSGDGGITDLQLDPEVGGDEMCGGLRSVRSEIG
jgi:hypothetical protein